MLKLIFLSACLSLTSLAGQTREPATSGLFSVHDMLAMERIQEFRVGPDGRTVAYTSSVTDLEANRLRSSIWIVMEGSAPRRLTPEGMAANSPRWAPDGSLYFVSAKSGSPQVWKMPAVGPEPTQVTDLPLGVDAVELSQNGDFLILAMAVFPGSTPEETATRQEAMSKRKASGMVFDKLMVRHWDTWRDGTRNHLFRYDLKAGEALDLMPDLDADAPTSPFGGSEEYAISPDGQKLVFTAKGEDGQEAWSTNLDLWEVPTDGSKPPARITSNLATDTQPAFSPDGGTLAYLAMSRAGYEADRQDLSLLDLETGKKTRVTVHAPGERHTDRSISEFIWAPDGKHIYCAADHLGQKAIFKIDVREGYADPVLEEGSASAPMFLEDGSLVFSLNTLNAPTELFVLGADSWEPRPLTDLNGARLAATRMGEPEQFTFEGARGDEVYGYIIRPTGFDPDEKYPIAFLIHGGPQGSFGNSFHYRWNPQVYAGAGYAVVMIDFHGSTGYGQEFTDAINGDWGGAPFEDLMKGLDAALGRYPFLDGERVGALGASYGGYMINWIAGRAPDRFRALVCHDGNLDERMAYFDTEELWFPEWEHGGTPWDNPEGYSAHNPIDYVDKWKTPHLIIHGVKDYRVVYAQGLSAFTALQRRGVPSRLLIFPDENHWVLKPANSIQWHDEVIGWLDRWVK